MGWAGGGCVHHPKDSVDPVPSRMGFSGQLSFTLPFLPRATRLACLQGANSLGPIPTPATPSPYSTLLPRRPRPGRLWGKRGPGRPANRALARLLKWSKNPFFFSAGTDADSAGLGPWVTFTLSLPSGGDTPAFSHMVEGPAEAAWWFSCTSGTLYSEWLEEKGTGRPLKRARRCGLGRGNPLRMRKGHLPPPPPPPPPPAPGLLPVNARG